MDAAEIYDSVIYADAAKPFETTRHRELEQQLKRAVDTVSNAVGPGLKNAVETLGGMAFDLVNSAHKCGIAQGIELAIGLQKILTYPLETAEKSDRGAVPVCKSEALERKAVGDD